MSLKSLTADRIAQLSPEKRERLKAMLAAKNHASAGIQPRNDDAELLLSFAQQGMWLVDQMGEMNTVYNLFRAFRLQGTLKIEALSKAVNTIIERHESLRTVIETSQGNPLQKILPPQPYPLEVVDLTHLNGLEQEAKVKACCEQENTTPIAIATGPLLRLKLLKLAQDQHLMLLNMHHMITDAHTSTLLMGELRTLYQTFATGQPNTLKPIPLQYADYAIWQRKHFTSDRLARERLYWQEIMAGAPPLTGFPCDFPRPAQQQFEGGQVTGRLQPELTESLRTFARDAGVTLNTLMLAGFKAFLYRYTQQPDLVLGMAVANRDQPGTEHIIGFLANQVPIRIKCEPQDSFAGFVMRCHKVLLDALAHKDLPFDLILDAVQPDRDPSHSPLYQTIFVYQPKETGDGQLDSDVTMFPYAFERQIAKSDLEVQIMDQGGQLLFAFNYAKALFQHETMVRIARLYQHFLQHLLNAPQARIASLPLLDSPEQKRQIEQLGRSEKQPAKPTTLQAIFHKAVARFGQQPALVFESETLSYEALNQRANQLAHHLIEHYELKPGKIAAILANTSIERIVAILAVLKTGAAYLPMNEHQPAARIEYMLEDTNPSVLISESDFMFDLDLEVPVFALDLQLDQLEEQNHNPVVASDPDYLAYVIYTSGSTGQPKGVLVPHRGPSILVQYQMQLFNPSFNRVLQFASLGFDAAVAEIFATFGMGATLYLAPKEALMPGDALLDFFNRHRISHTIMPPALLAQLNPVQFPHLKSILSMGERCGVGLVKKWGPGREFHNGYGPTENSIGAAMYVCDINEDRDPPLGPTLPHVQSYVLDDHLDLLPQSVAGELCVGGEGLTWGYLNRPALTASAFLPDPYADHSGARLYKTGDKVKYNPDHTIAFLGRVDFQVKIRGFRIEPEEIDKACTRFTAVEEAVVDVTEDGQNLIAFVVPSAHSQPEIDGFSRLTLPNGMAIAHHDANAARHNYQEVFENGAFDAPELILPSNGVLVDAGAGIGLFSLFASQMCPNSTIYTFEALPPNLERLAVNTKLYSPNAKTFPYALGEQETEIQLSFPSQPIDHRQESEDFDLAAAMLGAEAFDVPVKRLSDIIAQEGIDHIDLLNIADGARSLQVLAGIDAKHFGLIDQIILTLHPHDNSLQQAVSLLEGHGFRVSTPSKAADSHKLFATRLPPGQPKKTLPDLSHQFTPLFSVNGLRQHLEACLPGYMVPAYFCVLDALPLTANGKVDRKALPREQVTVATEEQGRAPETDTEKFLAELFQELLGVAIDDVGIHFFSAGGHSLLATQLIARVTEKFALTLPLRALFNHPTLEGFATHIDQQVRDKPTGERNVIEVRPNPADLAPLSFAQQRLWVVQQLGGNQPFYNIPFAFKCFGPLEINAFERALQNLVERHAILRTKLQVKQGTPYQDIGPAEAFSLVRETAPQPIDSGYQQSWIHQQTQHPFDLEEDLPLRCAMLEMGEGTYLISLTLHHLVMDGWSLGILLSELSALYKEAIGNEAASLPHLPIQYADYAVWQRQWLQGERLEQQLHFWKDYLQEIPQQLDLPMDYQRPSVQSFSGSQIACRLEKSHLAALQSLSQNQDTTLFNTLTTALQVLLAAYSQQEQFCLGTVVANRSQPELEHLIGFFVNTLALKADLSGNPSFEQLLARAKTNANLALDHQDAPFEMVLDYLGLDRNTSHSPLFQVMFTLQHASKSELALPDLKIEAVATPHETTKFDLTLAAIEDTHGLGLVWEYDTQLFKASTIETMNQRFLWLLDEICAKPQADLNHFLKLAPHQQPEIESFQMDSPALQQTTHVQLFEAHALAQPNAQALVTSTESWTYEQLNKKANQLAHLLIQAGLQPGDFVCFWAERSLAAVVSMLAIAKAGAAYVPLDPNAPQARHKLLLETTRPKLVLGPASLQTLVPQAISWEHSEALNAMPDTNPELALSPEFPAYMLFTSGSTGQPKGVVVPNRAIVSLALDQTYVTPINACLLAAPLSFDASTFEIWSTWLNGGRLVIAEATHLTPERIHQYIDQHQIDTLWITTGMFNQWVDTVEQVPDSLKQILTGGEQASAFRFKKALTKYPKVRLINCYGPTEVTTFTTSFCYNDYQDQHLFDIPLGRPIHHRGSYLLNRQLEPVAHGTPGCLFAEGPGLAWGYWGDARKTASCFLPHPFSTAPGQRLYNTGDMVRAIDDQIYFMGRSDHQIKLRGFRIELSEISSTLERHPDVARCRVLISGQGENRQLLGFWEPIHQESCNINPKSFLTSQLPAYMVPATLHKITQWPLKANGKVDEQALEALAQHQTVPAVAPSGELELQLQAFWSQVLQRQVDNVEQNFFELGGNSLNVVRLHHLLKEAGHAASLVNLFEHTTIAAQASFLTAAKAQSLEQRQERGKSRKQAMLRRKKKGQQKDAR